MIESVSLADFLSHKETVIRLGPNASVFVGNNGSGKSSVVDAITFALFGRHTRKNNRGLVRRGANSASAQVVFTVDGTRYMADRKIGIRGETIATLQMHNGTDWQVLITGERREFGESVTARIEEILGMDYEQLLIAGIVQQGELVSIVEEKPKKFKEMLNEIIGIDRLDAAASNMGDALKKFRSAAREQLGYDDLAVQQLASECAGYGQEVKRLQPQLKEREAQMAEAMKEIAGLKTQLESGREKLECATRLHACQDELVRHVKEAIERMRQEVESDEKKIADCTRCINVCEQTRDAQSELERVQQQERIRQQSVQNQRSSLAGLEEKLRLAGSLHLTDGKCPVCDSKVDSLKPIYDEQKLHHTIREAQERIDAATKDTVRLEKERMQIFEKLESQSRARAELEHHQIHAAGQLVQLQQSVRERERMLEKLPASVMLHADAITADIAIDEHSGRLYRMAEELRAKVAGFDEGAFKKIQAHLEDAEKRTLLIQSGLGADREALKRVQEQLDAKSQILSELNTMAEFTAELERIRDIVYGRDGHVATSLRSWALGSISSHATGYLDMFDTKVQRIELEEKTKDFTIKCYSGTTDLDIKSLSGGERVCVALAMRLGMAAAFGASRLNFVILDEPTAYLDAEKKSAMVRAITQRPDSQNGSQVQLVIISHDREIFENTAVDDMYSFEQNGSLPDSPTVVRSNASRQ